MDFISPTWERLQANIAAGTPIEAIENFEEELTISPGLFVCDHCFGLRVSGDSMIEAHILDGYWPSSVRRNGWNTVKSLR